MIHDFECLGPEKLNSPNCHATSSLYGVFIKKYFKIWSISHPLHSMICLINSIEPVTKKCFSHTKIYQNRVCPSNIITVSKSEHVPPEYDNDYFNVWIFMNVRYAASNFLYVSERSLCLFLSCSTILYSFTALHSFSHTHTHNAGSYTIQSSAADADISHLCLTDTHLQKYITLHRAEKWGASECAGMTQCPPCTSPIRPGFHSSITGFILVCTRTRGSILFMFLSPPCHFLFFVRAG